MSNQVTVTLPDEIYQRAERLAELTGQTLAEIVAQTVEHALPVMPSSAPPVSELNDDEVLALTELQMDSEDDERLSILLEHQREGLLTDPERTELFKLMQTYKAGLLRKSQALREAVTRALISPLQH